MSQVALTKSNSEADRRSAWIAANGPCRQCGSSVRLETDHIDPSTKDPRLKRGGPRSTVWGWREPDRLREIAKCQVLCRACHMKKTIRETYKPRQHGTTTMYRNGGCRCRQCVSAKTAATMRRRRELGKNRLANKFKTHCIRGHEFNEQNTAVTANGGRRCKLCRRVSLVPVVSGGFRLN